MSQNWRRYLDDDYDDEIHETRKTYKIKNKNQKLDHKKAKQMQEAKKNGSKYPKTKKRRS